MTITIRKLHLAIAVLAVALIVPATTAVAFHVFDDVPDDRFYSDAVEWAAANGITTGTSATTFEPEANVTRGQNVTFAKRYDDNIVQPALDELGSDIAANATDIAGVTAPIPTLNTAEASQAASTTSVALSTLIPDMTTSFTVGAGTTEIALVTFSSMHACEQDPVEATHCMVQLFVDGVASRVEREFDSVLHSGALVPRRGVDTHALGSHSTQWVTDPLPPGTHTVEVRYRVTESNSIFTVGADRVLSVINFPT